MCRTHFVLAPSRSCVMRALPAGRSMSRWARYACGPPFGARPIVAADKCPKRRRSFFCSWISKFRDFPSLKVPKSHTIWTKTVFVDQVVVRVRFVKEMGFFVLRRFWRSFFWNLKVKEDFGGRPVRLGLRPRLHLMSGRPAASLAQQQAPNGDFRRRFAANKLHNCCFDRIWTYNSPAGK